MSDDDARKQFKKAVNMSPGQLERWLKTDESRRAGQHENGGEAIGHKSGRRIVKLLRKKKSELTDADRKHMVKVAGYVSRHTAQRPSGDVTDTTWRHSLMNWGHDPLKRTS